MAIRANHYDAAFEAYVRTRCWAYVAVNEARRARLAERTLKSLDFIVSSPQWGQLLVDVKGRRWPGPGERGRRWENWVTQDDLDSMQHWEAVFGEGYRGLIVFAYDLPAERSETDVAEAFAWRGRDYAFFGVWVSDYRQAMRTRSPRWDTVWLPSQPFRDLRFPLAGERPASVTAP